MNLKDRIKARNKQRDVILVEVTSMRAMVVDDSRAAREILGAILGDLGVDVVKAVSGKDALANLKESSDIGVVFVDWIMPEMNGIEFIRAVRNDASLDDVGLVMVTTQSELAQVENALEAGANEYVMKPVTKEIIQEKLALLGVAERDPRFHS